MEITRHLYLGWIHVFGRQLNDSAVHQDDVYDTPVSNLRHGQSCDSGKRSLVVKGGCQGVAYLDKK